MSGAVAVLARIEEIRTSIQHVSPAARAATAATAARTSATSALAAASVVTGATAPSSATDFDAALAALTPAVDPGLLSRLSGASAPAAPAVPAAAAPAAGPTGADLVAEARKYLGVPYVWGGESADGLDCSGLVQRALGALGVEMPRVARDQMHEGTPVASMTDARVGDLLVFDGGSHIAIYLGDGRMIDAPKPGKVVSERDVYETPTAIRRVLPGTDDGLVASSAAQRSSLSLLLGGAA